MRPRWKWTRPRRSSSVEARLVASRDKPRKSAMSERLMTRLNADLPALSSDLRSVTQNLNALTDQARSGVEHASVLLHAVGEVGESVQEMHNVVRGSSGTLLTNVASLVAGVKAATRVMRNRYRQEGEPYNGA